jgi:NAD(P)-dependent dehydrogenase (short-subunit alcohol dehydrogenase family)
MSATITTSAETMVRRPRVCMAASRSSPGEPEGSGRQSATASPSKGRTWRSAIAATAKRPMRSSASSQTVLKMTDEDWYKVIAVNLSGAFFMSQAVLPHTIDRGSGRIVNISSIIGEMGNMGQANSAASKSG